MNNINHLFFFLYIKDKIEGKTIELMFYPPSNRFYNSKDVLKYMK